MNNMLFCGWQGNPQQAGNFAVQLQRLSEEGAAMRKRQSGLHGNMQKAAEMTASTKRTVGKIQRWHWEKNMSLRSIAAKLGMTYASLQWYLRRFNLPRRGRVESMNIVFDGHGPNWKGGRITDQFGYIHIKDKQHPNADKRGYVPEHRQVMSEFIKRPIAADEVVHHVNGVVTDNRLENLELRKRGGKDYYHGPLAVCPHCGKPLGG